MMRKFATFLFLATLCQLSLQAAEGHCRKCEVMKDYYKDHPSKYKYYEDYLKDLEEKGADAVEPDPKDLPPDVKFIMDQQKVSGASNKKQG